MKFSDMLQLLGIKLQQYIIYIDQSSQKSFLQWIF